MKSNDTKIRNEHLEVVSMSGDMTKDVGEVKEVREVKSALKKFVINISGSKFEVSENTYITVKKGVPNKHKSDIYEFSSELYAERHPGAFQCILYHRQGGDLHLPAELCPSAYKRELDFWGVDELQLAKCCFAKYMAYFDDQEVLKILEADETARNKETQTLMSMSKMRGWRGIQGKTWLILNEPFYSISSKVYFILSAFLIILSIFALVAGTHSTFQRSLDVDEWKTYFGDDWDKYAHLIVGTSISEPEAEGESEPEATTEPEAEGESEPETTSEPEVTSKPESTSEPETTSEPEAESEQEAESESELVLPENAYARFLFLDIIEFICIGFFSLDLIVRVIFCPFRFSLLTSFLNWVDIFALLVMYLKYGLESIYPKEKYESSLLDILHCLQVVRVFRLFRLVKNFIGFRVLYYAFKASFVELLLMSMFLLVATLLFSTFVYFSGDDNFPSIPEAFWWAIITMTTVGYGDIVPKIGLSKTIGVFCAISGVCLIAVIVPVFVNNFMMFYTYSKVWGKKSENDNQNVKVNQVMAVDDLKNNRSNFF